MRNRKWICVLLSMILMLSSALTAFAGTSLDTALNKVNLYMKAEKGAQLMTWKGIIDADNFATAMIVYETEDGEELPAYCANPDKPGVEEMASHTYDVDVDQLDQNPEVWGVITNGYPYKSPAELGVSTDYEAYYATKMAVWAVVHDNYSDLDDWAANGSQNTAVEQAMKNLVAIGRANEYVYNTWLATTPTSPTLQEEGDYYTQTYELTSNVELERYYIVLSGDVPDGTVVLSESGEEETEFDGTENSFSIQIPKDSITEEGTFRVLVKATLENKSVMYGNSHDDTQDYYVAPMPTYNGDSWIDITYSADDGAPPTTDTTDPDEPTTTTPTTTTGLNILKVDAGTNDGLSGAVIRVTNATGGVIGTYVTDDSGSINIQDLPTGAYYIEEIVAPDGYVLDENPHQDVVLEEDRDTTVTFANQPESKLEITKVDADTGEKLDGAIFRVALDDGSNSFDVQTDNSGVAYLSNMKSGTYTVTEIVAPDGYLLDDTPQIIKLVAGETATLTMQNEAEPGLLVRKVDEDTGMPLANAVFNIAKKGETTIYEMTTDKAGEIKVEGLEEGWYTITETTAPSGYLLETESKDVYLEPNQLVEVMFTNRLRPSLQIMKIDAVTNEPLAGATFKVTKTEDMTVSEYITDSTGTIVIRDLDEAVYTVEEISAPTGYILDTQHKDIALEWGKTKTLVFENTKNPTLIVTKINGLTNEPIAGTVFEIQYENPDGGIENLGTYQTDASGKIVIENVESGWYIVTETIPAQGFSLPSNPTTRIYLSEGENAYLTLDETGSDDSQTDATTSTTVTSGSDYTGGVTNYPLNSIVIKKVDANTSEMLAGAVFELRQVSEDISGNSGTIIGRYTTDNSGIVVVTGLTAGAYIIEEVDPPTNYLLSENSQQQAWLKADGTSIVEMTFTNYPYGSLLINKVDENDGTPLAGAVFKVTTGDGTLVGSSNGEYTTDQNGEILIPNLKPDSYVVTEIQAPSGYVINSTAKTIDIGTDGKTYALTFSNQPLSGLKIIKLDSETREPLADAEFEVRKLNGEYVGDYKTDYNGTFFVEDLEDGFYEVTEQKAPTGYHLDNEPKVVEVKSTQETVLEVLNEPYSDLVIEKMDSQTGDPIKGVEFLITKLNGEEIGYYTTDKYGLITIEGLASGDYILKETESADGYKIEDTAIEFTIIDGQRTTVEVENTPMSSLFIRKIDSVTKEGIGGVKFLLYDADNDPIGEYESDNEGYVWLDKTLEDGKYKLREIEAAEGYIGDDEVKTFWVKEGKTTEIIWENTPEAGQIVITKRSSEYNELTGLPAGSPLSGAVFEIYNITGNLVDQITSDSDGVAASSLLPVGVYTIKEVSAPRYYALNDTMLLAEIRHNGDIIRFEVLNSSIDLDLSIQKKGPVQIMPSSTIHYEIYGVENGSSGSIEDFYIHDRIPTDATRILKITTGTFNERGYYTITYKTNYRDYMVLADNLLTENDYEFSLHSNVLGLQNGEYVTDVRFEFDSVSSGFVQTKNISVFCQVLPTMPSGYQIINRAEVGGRYGNEWESRTTSWNTTVFGLNPTYVTLPQTGY